ncbi:hypothetical protein MJA45_06030 [Paenibacillus aurantius]|uniref:Uncharacterized protein n=1 Tax=Paenibacillus aurantius TaxID=2918900 RepID=A0AA96LIH9_9BACL|nr:hypothetical protein [Paenibacillus aurantius]WNQ12586.1 hypothetical protein MJA45_06030 [Paenibacillus aurantius]
MIPFDRTWPYETVQKDVYVRECPFCGSENVLLPLRTKDLQPIREGAKKLLVFPCCYSRVTIVDNDPDYLLADQPLRGRRTDRT